MENLNTTYGGIEKKQIEKDLASKETSNTVNDINKKLLDVFGINETKVNKLSDENEVNLQEAQLAQMFGTYEKMIKLNNSNSNQTLSLASVMAQLDLVTA